MKNTLVYPVCILIVTLLTACDFRPNLEKRAGRAAKAKGDIVIGIVHSSLSANFFLEGINLAVEIINQGDGLMGRRIRTIVYDDMGDPVKAEKIARKLAAQDGLIAVIGHGSSKTAIPASIIYEKAGIVFISYGAKSPNLTLYGGHYTFRNIPTQKDFARKMARYTNDAGLKKIVVFHEREASQKSLADFYKKEAAALGTEIIATRSYFDWERDFKDTIDQLKKEYKFDAIVISGIMPAAAELVKQLDELGVTVPIIGSDGLDSPDLFAIAGKASEGIVVPSVYNPGLPDKLTKMFIQNFQKKFDLSPDTWAAQGFDALSLLAHIIEKNGSTIPAVLSSDLRFLKKWHGVTGSYSFVPQGDIIGKEITFKEMHSGVFVFIRNDQQYNSNLFNYIEDLSLRLPIVDPVTTLDPVFINNDSDVEVAEQIFLGLTGLDSQTGEAVPELALEWGQITIDDSIYIYKMRKDNKKRQGKSSAASDLIPVLRENIESDTTLFNIAAMYNVTPPGLPVKRELIKINDTVYTYRNRTHKTWANNDPVRDNDTVVQGIQTADPSYLLIKQNDEFVYKDISFIFSPMRETVYPDTVTLFKKINITEHTTSIYNYIFRMRDDVRWTDNDSVTADDVVWAIKRNLSSDTSSSKIDDLFIIHNSQTFHNEPENRDVLELGVSAYDDYTVQFKLNDLPSDFPALVSLPLFRPLPKAVIKEHGDTWTDLDKIVTNGPYKPVVWEKSKGMFLKKNRGYFDKNTAAIPELRYFIIPQETVGLAMYKNNELDIMGGSYLGFPVDTDASIKNGNMKSEYHEGLGGCVYGFSFNTSLMPVNNLLVRKAVSMAINRQLLVDTVNKGSGQPVAGVVPPTLIKSVSRETDMGISFDPVQARKWLAKAGFPEGKNFPELTLLTRKSHYHQNIANGIAAFLKHYLHINVRVKPVDKNHFTTIVSNKKSASENPSHLFITRICGEYPAPDSYLKHFDPSTSLYKTGWKNQNFTEIMDKARNTPELAQRLELYQKADELLCRQDVITIPLFQEQYHALVKPRIKGWSHATMGGQQIQNWSFEGR